MRPGRKFLFVFFCLVMVVLFAQVAEAQCSVCTRTVQQLGTKSARGLNAGIMYLAFTPLAIMGVIGYKWWKKNQKAEA
jgi:hypothetical protein